MTVHNEDMNINAIARIGESMANKEFSKAACFNAFKSALENDGQLNVMDMAKLYRHFMPAIPAKPKTDFQWVALAMGNKDVRYYLNFVYSDGKRLMATDGHRLHLVYTDDYKPGFYDKAGTWLHDTDFAKFPDVNRIIPETDKQIKLDSMELNHDMTASKEYQRIYDFDEIRVCSKYLDQAIEYQNTNTIHYLNKDRAVVIRNNDKLAVVMPMRK